jgi:hypothetical protein
VYQKPPQSFTELVAPFPPDVREVASWLRDLILREFPQVEEAVYGGTKVGNALYSVGSPDRVAVGIQPGGRFVKLFVHDPEHLGTPPFKLEGSGKHMRHVKFSEVPAERRAELLALVRIPIERRSTSADPS